MLDEFQKAVQSSYDEQMSDDTRDRHREFIVAIENQVSKIEKSMKDTAHSEGKGTPRWVRLNEDERDELALFLTGPSESEGNIHSNNHVRVNDLKEVSDKEPTGARLKNPSDTMVCVPLEIQEGKPHGHRRTASCTAETGAWNISISDDNFLQNSSDETVVRVPRKVPSFSGFLNFMEPTANVNWSKNCVRKWKAADRQQESDVALLPTQAHRQVVNASCYERSKSCLECEECYEKPLHGWYGALQRQLQRSQYQMQYSKPVQVTIWILLVIFLIVLVAVHTM
ncbi:PREDICTED: uncharacterized protein LOC104820507 isoform X2 [Tarenaya hassleriana]|uniref:uncharacterized protein LOC104820507 isoform X2 n=1 Tax=Tarenaya hassleriana TaxID=28532 RepID=UPI00053C0C61|nr:PREDICTED: uncharacterized protein LOC104820507 isoform X2 [Tarenaya hassleriana]